VCSLGDVAYYCSKHGALTTNIQQSKRIWFQLSCKDFFHMLEQMCMCVCERERERERERESDVVHC